MVQGEFLCRNNMHIIIMIWYGDLYRVIQYFE